jgi:hypothetical protein
MTTVRNLRACRTSHDASMFYLTPERLGGCPLLGPIVGIPYKRPDRQDVLLLDRLPKASTQMPIEHRRLNPGLSERY